MAFHARLAPPKPQQESWPWHHTKHTTIMSNALMRGDRRMEADNYLMGGYGIRVSIEIHKSGWTVFRNLARAWQPNRLKGIVVDKEHGTPFLAAGQVFDLRPTPRKYLSLGHTANSANRFVKAGTILLTCSGNVGRATIASSPHKGVLISHDLLRVEPNTLELRGWIYAYLRSPQAWAMMNAVQYGHIIKHLETSHMDNLPIPVLRNELLEPFAHDFDRLLKLREEAYSHTIEAEHIFAKAFGGVEDNVASYAFSVNSASLVGSRRRFDASFYAPKVSAIVNRISSLGYDKLSDVVESVWLMARIKRIFGDGGVPYLSADGLFSTNPKITKKVLIEQTSEAKDFYVKSGWIVMARSGQVYGLNGSVALMTERHQNFFLSDDLIRISPKINLIRPGYLLTALGHPKFGRPLVIRNAYGTSIPHLEPADIANVPVVRLGREVEGKIADLAERAEELRSEADILEDAMAANAEKYVDKFIAGNTSDFSISVQNA